MSIKIKSNNQRLSVILILLGIIVLFYPNAENIYAPLLGVFSILVGVFMLTSMYKKDIANSHPIFTVITSIVLIGLGGYTLAFSASARFGFLATGLLFIVIALTQYADYESRKGSEFSFIPFVNCIVLWFFAVILVKGAGSADVKQTLIMSGIFFIVSGVLVRISTHLAKI